jgi:hypothetical protein
MKYYALVIDTDQYAGNFEREMASYCTNLEFPRGDEYCSNDVEHSDWWEENTYPHYNGEWDEGCSIWPTPGWSNNGMGQHRRIKDGEKMKWPAFMSVAIFSDIQPPTEVIEEVRKRATEFTKVYRYQPITVTGVRLIVIEETTTKTEIELS